MKQAMEVEADYKHCMFFVVVSVVPDHSGPGACYGRWLIFRSWLIRADGTRLPCTSEIGFALDQLARANCNMVRRAEIRRDCGAIDALQGLSFDVLVPPSAQRACDPAVVHNLSRSGLQWTCIFGAGCRGGGKPSELDLQPSKVRRRSRTQTHCIVWNLLSARTMEQSCFEHQVQLPSPTTSAETLKHQLSGCSNQGLLNEG